MNNTIDHAARVIAVAQSECHSSEPEVCGACYNHLVEGRWLAKRLADTGLLAPDLPEPTITPCGDTTWAAGTVYFDETEQSIGIELPGRLRGLEAYAAREIGRGLLAAADYQEKGATNE